jgi:uncharacterized damage-inducible protein DinB
MSEVKRLSEALAKAYEGGAWHGPSVREAVAGVDARRAAARPIPGGHTIWELVLHIAGWDDVLRRRLLGEPAEEPEEGDFPAVTDTSEAAWAAALERLARNNAALRTVVATIHDEDLASPPPNSETPRYVSLTGVLQHEIYHAGQISLLKKAE